MVTGGPRQTLSPERVHPMRVAKNTSVTYGGTAWRRAVGLSYAAMPSRVRPRPVTHTAREGVGPAEVTILMDIGPPSGSGNNVRVYIDCLPSQHYLVLLAGVAASRPALRGE